MSYMARIASFHGNKGNEVQRFYLAESQVGTVPS